MARVSFYLKVPSHYSREYVDSLVENLYRAALKVRKELKVNVDVHVEEVATAFPAFYTFQTFHTHSMSKMVGAKLEVKTDLVEESADNTELVFEIISEELSFLNLEVVADAGMSGVGVADVM